MHLRALLVSCSALVVQVYCQPGLEGVFIPNASGIGGTISGPLQSTRNAKKASADTGRALDDVLNLLVIDDLSALPVDTVNNIPAENLAKLPPDTLAVMPNSILAKLSADAHIKSTIVGELIQHMSVDKLNHPDFPWDQVIGGLPPDAMNSYSPSLMGAIPWEDVIDKVPMDTLAGMQLQSMMMIPPAAMAKLSAEQVAAINPAVLSRLPLNSLQAIPLEHLEALPPQQLEGFSMDILNALGGSLPENGAGVVTSDTHAQALGLAGPSRGRAFGRQAAAFRQRQQFRNQRQQRWQ